MGSEEKIQTHFSSIRTANSSTNKYENKISVNELEQEILPGFKPDPVSPSLSSEERSLHRLSFTGHSISPVERRVADKRSYGETLSQLLALGNLCPCTSFPH